jgi:hypothetical protein
VALVKSLRKEGHLKRKYVSCPENILQFLQDMEKGFHYLLRENLSLLILFGWSLISFASLMILSMHLDFLDKILVSFIRIQWLRLMLC